jgi:putative transposase
MHGMQSGLRCGGPWRLMPHDRPHWQTAYQCFRTWRRDGTWGRIHEQRRADVRTRMGRQPQPSAVIDAQTVQTTAKGGHGFDGGKQRNGRTRQLLGETPGFLWRVLAQAADLREAVTAPWRLAAACAMYTQCQRLWADLASRRHVRRVWLAANWGGGLEIVQRPRRWGRSPLDVAPPPMPALTVLPLRWVGACTIAWSGR